MLAAISYTLLRQKKDFSLSKGFKIKHFKSPVVFDSSFLKAPLNEEGVLVWMVSYEWGTITSTTWTKPKTYSNTNVTRLRRPTLWWNGKFGATTNLIYLADRCWLKHGCPWSQRNTTMNRIDDECLLKRTMETWKQIRNRFILASGLWTVLRLIVHCYISISLQIIPSLNLS